MTSSLDIVPQHIAIVMDGNGRWAQQRGKKRMFGHKQGVETVRNVLKLCDQFNIPYLTLFAFSSENWKRPEEEVSSLMNLFFIALEQEAKALAKNGVRLQLVGERSAFSKKLQRKIAQVEDLTREGNKLRLNIAANYGGRWDIVSAASQLAKAGQLINEESLGQYLATRGMPDPDLFIRTGGEKRLSNFLLWQSAYAELYFTDVLWPDFNDAEFKKALDDFSSRQRRFGQTGEQVTSTG